MQVKLFALAKRKPGMSLEAFLEHWRHPHGTLAKQVKLVTGYVQHRPEYIKSFGLGESRFDGIAELEVANEADAAAFGTDPDYVRDLIPDEEKFIDRSSLNFLCVTGDAQQYSRPSGSAESLWQSQKQNMATYVLQFSEVPMTGDARTEEGLAKQLGALRFQRYMPSLAMHGEAPPFTGVRWLAWPTLGALQRGTNGKNREWSQLFGPVSSSLMVVTSGERVN